jgi:hypothetical protein
MHSGKHIIFASTFTNKKIDFIFEINDVNNLVLIVMFLYIDNFYPWFVNIN